MLGFVATLIMTIILLIFSCLSYYKVKDSEDTDDIVLKNFYKSVIIFSIFLIFFLLLCIKFFHNKL